MISADWHRKQQSRGEATFRRMQPKLKKKKKKKKTLLIFLAFIFSFSTVLESIYCPKGSLINLYYANEWE